MTQEKIIILLYNQVFVIHIYSLFCQKVIQWLSISTIFRKYQLYILCGNAEKEKAYLLVKKFYPSCFSSRLFSVKMLTRGTVALTLKIFLSCYSCSYRRQGRERKSISQQLSYLMKVYLVLAICSFCCCFKMQLPNALSFLGTQLRFCFETWIEYRANPFFSWTTCDFHPRNARKLCFGNTCFEEYWTQFQNSKHFLQGILGGALAPCGN